MTEDTIKITISSAFINKINEADRLTKEYKSGRLTAVVLELELLERGFYNIEFESSRNRVFAKHIAAKIELGVE